MPVSQEVAERQEPPLAQLAAPEARESVVEVTVAAVAQTTLLVLVALVVLVVLEVVVAAVVVPAKQPLVAQEAQEALVIYAPGHCEVAALT